MIRDSFVALGMGLEEMICDVNWGIVLQVNMATEWHVVVVAAASVGDG